MTSVREKLEAILARLEAREDSERVFMKLYKEEARQAADAADLRRAKGQSLGALDGRIVSIKDLVDVAGEVTLAGSVIRRDAAPASEDATVLRRLRDAGAVIIGKTHMTEFAFTPVGLNPHYPVPGNAADPTRVPGGSSSGAGVSVAEGTSEIALGSDTGGSIRIPAALNGVVGFKPSAQRVPLQGTFPLSPALDSIGPLANNVADCILTDAVFAGEAVELPQAIALRDLRIGLPVGLMISDLDATVAAGFAAALDALKQAGAQLIDIEIDDLIKRMNALMSVGSIVGIEAARIHAASWLGDPDANVDVRVKGPLSRRIQVSDETYAHMLATRNELAAEMDERLKQVDFIVTPATPIVAATIASVETDELEYDRVETILLRNTQIGNRFDLCSITLPVANMPLPVGLMLTARNGTDKHMLAGALSVEQALN